MVSCVFCAKLERRNELIFCSEVTAAFFDAFPISPGHALVIPRRHEPDFFNLTAEEESEIWRGVREVRKRLQADRAPEGFNIGVNAGRAAGQTVDHAHVHLIPRYVGDVEDPRGGVRSVIPAKAAYWDR